MKTLQDYRKEIDGLDDEIIALLRARFEIVRKVGGYKASNALEVVQTNRVVEVLDRVRNIAMEQGLDPDFIASLYQVMIDHAHVLESEIRTSHDDQRNRAVR